MIIRTISLFSHHEFSNDDNMQYDNNELSKNNQNQNRNRNRINSSITLHQTFKSISISTSQREVINNNFRESFDNSQREDFDNDQRENFDNNQRENFDKIFQSIDASDAAKFTVTIKFAVKKIVNIVNSKSKNTTNHKSDDIKLKFNDVIKFNAIARINDVFKFSTSSTTRFSHFLLNEKSSENERKFFKNEKKIMRKLNQLTRKYYLVTLFNIKTHELVQKIFSDMRLNNEMYFRIQKKMKKFYKN